MKWDTSALLMHLEDLPTSRYFCYCAVCSGSKGTETGGRRAPGPSLNLSWWFMPRITSFFHTPWRHELWCKSVQESVRRHAAATWEGRKGFLCTTAALWEFISLKCDTEMKRYSSENQVTLYTGQERQESLFLTFKEWHCSKKGKRKGTFVVG